MKSPDKRSYFSDSLARGLLVLRAFDGTSPRLRVSEIAERTKLSRAVARRYLLTLRDLGYVGTDGEAFFLRPRVLDFGHQYFAATNIGSLIQPLLVEFAERTQEATTLGVMDNQEVLVVARAAKRMLDLAIGSGSRLPILQTSLGRILAAHLPDKDLAVMFSALNVDEAERARLQKEFSTARRQEYALVQNELAPKLVAVAVPLYDRRRQVVAALNVTSYTSSRKELVSNFLPILIETKLQIEAALRSSNNALGDSSANVM